MEILRKKMISLSEALGRFSDVLETPLDSHDFILDAAIHRFQFCYDLTWKSLQRLLAIKGVRTHSPHSTFTEALREVLISERIVWERIVKDRNSTTHEYDEFNAREVYSRLKTYLGIMHSALTAMQIEIEKMSNNNA